MYNASLRFSDGHVETVDVASGCNVLKAALDAGIGLASQCQSGSCGTCVAQLRDGHTETVPGRASALLDSEYREGGRLLCSTLLHSPAEFQLPYPSDVLFGDRPKVHTATVTELVPLSETVLGLRVRIEGQPLGFRAGQYARIRVPGTHEWRSYSMAGPPDNGSDLEFHVRLLPDGRFSSYLRDGCTVGTQLEVDGAYGSFVLRPGKDHHLFVAGGTGLAPILSMIDHLREQGSRRTPVTLCYACRTEIDLYYAEEVGLRPLWMPRMEARLAITEPSAAGTWTGRVGTPVSLIEPQDVGERTTAYLCGPPGMIDAARHRLRGLGLPAEQIHSERFVSSEE
ncbi:FAD-binding oxidoreductase [Pseudonocardia asaccharolytica]|uniref:Anthranilate dioxygenase reductase n=1 Tax=Pseudonocardia asaccharolytica DSM 44247 = NBRC 16224 TaxID=1123024 RepID=A0A511CZN5_9PSEU|nr:2Fe-2S iron-sulfur cluster binding domain-containing protein [Pseudonocardia asaccharolytica]GEL17927.1 anthranilate dioxygenase reductase [Pseudonocardia asaccharolytica DSM 44247 = NBRC 16224]